MVSKMPDKRTLRILICDADREFVQAAERILGSEGHTVVAEADLCKAARLVLKSTPDVVVLPSEFADDRHHRQPIVEIGTESAGIYLSA